MAVENHSLMASLYVGDLHPDVTETDLAATFIRVGPLLSVHICRDKISRKSLCYGYVNFWFRCHASAALKCLNHTRLKGETMRIMWRQRNPIARKSGVGNLFVKNLDQSITGARLQEIFSEYGTILSCKVAEEKGISKGFGFVHFESEDSAIAALNALHDTEMGGKKIHVSKFLKKAERKKDAERCLKNLHVKNLDEDITEDILKEKFSEHGKVLSAVILKDDNGKPKGCGFVNFEEHEGAEKAMEALNGELLGTKNLCVAWAQRRGEIGLHFGQEYGYKLIDHCQQPKASHMYVKNHNSRYGKLVFAKVIQDDDGVSNNFGPVRFSCPEEAKQPLNSLTGTDFDGRTLNVALAHHQEQQTNELANSWKKFSPNYISNCQPLDCRQFPCSRPLMPFVLPNQRDPTFCQNFAQPFSSCNPFQGQDFRGIFNTFPLRVSDAALDGCGGYNYTGYQLQPPGSQSQNNIINNVKYYCEGHGAMRNSFAMPSPEAHKIGQRGYRRHTLDQNQKQVDVD